MDDDAKNPLLAGMHESRACPKDGMAYFVMVLLGIGCLLPWNAFVTAVDYFEYYYPEYHPDRTIPVCYMCLNVVTTALIVKYGVRLDLGFRLRFGLWGYFVAMFGVPLTDRLLLKHVGEDHGSFEAMMLTLSFVAIIGISNGFVQGSLFGFCGPLPAELTSALVLGTALSGVFVCALRIGTKAAFGDTVAGLRLGIYTYFLSGGCYSILCYALYTISLPRLKVVRWYNEEEAREQRLRLGDGDGRGGGHGDLLRDAEAPALGGASESDADPASMGGGGGGSGKGPHGYGSPPAAASGVIDDVPLGPLFRKLWRYALAVFINYWVTLSIFPGVLAEDISSKLLGSWFTIVLITLFNCADSVGRMLPSVFYARDGAVLLVFSAIRVAFIPCYSLLVKHQTGDVSFMVVTGVLGLTNGYVTTATMATPDLAVTSKQEAVVAGTMMVFFLLSGLSAGAISGWIWLLTPLMKS